MNSIIWVETLLVYTVCRTSHLWLTIHSRVMKIHSSVQMNRGGGQKFYMMCHVEGYKAPSTWKCMKMIACEPKIFIGYKIHFFTDCYKEIIILHKWTCTEIMTYPKTLFSSKSWKSFSKERLHSTDTCHCSILINIEKNSNKRWGPLYLYLLHSYLHGIVQCEALF